MIKYLFKPLFLLFVPLLWITPQQLAAQILAKDTIQVDTRYPFITYAQNAYALTEQNLDTTIHKFHNYHPALYQGEFEHLYLGNLGAAHYPKVFEYAPDFGFQMGFRQFQRYWYHQDSVRYLRNRYPLAHFYYLLGPEEEQVIQASFGHTLKKKIGYNLDYRRITSQGIYMNQQSGHHNFAGSFWYKSNHQRYQVLGHYLHNSAKVEQNGGVIDPTIMDSSFVTRSILSTNLSEAFSSENQNSFFVQQSYDWGTYRDKKINDTLIVKQLIPKFRLGHRFRYTQRSYAYTDDSPPSSFYNNFYINTIQTADSLSWSDYENEVFVSILGTQKDNIKQQNFSIQTGLRYNHLRINQFNRLDFTPLLPTIISQGDSTYVQSDTLVTEVDTLSKLNNVSAFFYLQNPYSSNFHYRLRAQYALLGFNQNDLLLDAQAQYRLSKKLGEISAQAIIRQQTPDFITQFYHSNHQWWKNNLDKTNSLQARFSYANHMLRTRLSYAYHVVNKPIIWSVAAQPQQLDNAVNVHQITVNQGFKWRSFYLDNALVYQQSTNDIIAFPESIGKAIALPEWSGKHRFYYQNKVFKKALFMKVGAELRYNTAYFTPNYSPSIGQFYVQNDTNLPFYPVVDLFLSLRINRVRLGAMLNHINQGLLKRNGYFGAPNYPMPDRGFRVNISWLFYD